MNMKKIFLIFIFSNFLFSHDFWIEISNPFPKENEEIKIYIKGGHKISESEFSPKEKIIKEFKIIEPDGNEISLSFKKEKNYIYSEFKPYKKGTYLVYFLFEKGDEIFYLGKSYFYILEKTETKNLNYDFEISLKNLDFKEKMEFEKGNYEFMNKKGNGFFKEIYKPYKGWNCIIKRKGGKVCTLTFYFP